MVNGFLNSYFGFNRQQRNGLFMLMCISLLLLVIRLVYPHFMAPGTILLSSLPITENSFTDSAITRSNAALFFFDPNTASEEDLIRLGLSARTSATLIKYRERHFFSKKEDLLNVYGFRQSDYNKLSPYVQISAAKKVSASKNHPENKSVEKKPAPLNIQQKIVDLNSADSLTLLSVRGIGPVFAARIIKYRNMLGGFVAVSQLREVYGIDRQKYEQFHGHFSADKGAVKKLDLNNDDFKTINRHPYISYELTKKIFDYRRKGKLHPASLKEITESDSLADKLLPYVLF